jgi:hypothetical protein
MKKILIGLILFSGILFGQTFLVQNVKGDVKAQVALNENWTNVKDGSAFSANTIVQTGKKSSAEIKINDQEFILNQSSAVDLNMIKKMSVDDLLLALAMEDMINAPMKKDKTESKNTAVYGAEENGKTIPFVNSDDFGIKRLNGAVELSENGYNGSSIIFAKETFRKYPDTNLLPSYRIFFANELYKLGLYREAYDDFSDIQKLKLNKNQSKEVSDRLDDLGKKLAKQ